MFLFRLEEDKRWISASFCSTLEVLSGAQPTLLSVLVAGRVKIRFW